MNIAVILVGYNRPKSLARLYRSVVSAHNSNLVDIIFSIDKSPVQKEVLREIESFTNNENFLYVRALPERLGLREHILSCGDLVEDYDAVVVLEDDVVVSDSFVDYVVQAVRYVETDNSVAGISLYSPSVNEMSMLPFSPKRGGFDNYYLQSAQSWGQCWTREMWNGFRNWYAENCGKLEPDSDMPNRIYSWPDTSWKKYYMKYLVESGKTFFYPYDSLSSNYADVGQHNKMLTPHFQVPLVSGKREFKFGTIDEVPCYDVFFERAGCQFNGEYVCMDLYGTKTISQSNFLLTPKKLKAPIVQSFGLTYRPQEDNYLKRALGDDIFLYDLSAHSVFRMKEKTMFYKLAKYHTNLSWRHSLVFSLHFLLSRVFQKIKGK